MNLIDQDTVFDKLLHLLELDSIVNLIAVNSLVQVSCVLRSDFGLITYSQISLAVSGGDFDGDRSRFGLRRVDATSR